VYELACKETVSPRKKDLQSYEGSGFEKTYIDPRQTMFIRCWNQQAPGYTANGLCHLPRGPLIVGVRR